MYAVLWRKAHPEIATLLDTMLPCTLQEEAEAALDSGYMPAKLQYALEQIIKPIISAPMRDSRIMNVAGSVHKAYFDTRPANGEKFYRADFSTREGWGGRIETTDESTISMLTGTPFHSNIEISAWVSWSRDSYAILVEPITIIRLSDGFGL